MKHKKACLFICLKLVVFKPLMNVDFLTQRRRGSQSVLEIGFLLKALKNNRAKALSRKDF